MEATRMDDSFIFREKTASDVFGDRFLHLQSAITIYLLWVLFSGHFLFQEDSW